MVKRANTSPITPMSKVYARGVSKSPCGDTARVPCMPRGRRLGRRLELDQAQSGGGDHRLQLGVDIQLLYDVPNVPLDGVGGDAEPLGERHRVVSLRQQAEHVELARREVGEQLLAGLPVGHDFPLARY